MPRKTAAQKAAEEAAAAEAARRETEQQRLKWVGVAIIALALFAGGYAAGQSNAEDDARGAFAPLIVEGEFPGGFEFDGGLPPFLDDFDGEFPPFGEEFEFGGEFDFDFGFDRFERPRGELVCSIIERGGGTMVLECEGPALFDRVPEGERRDDQRRDDERRDDERRDDEGRTDEPGFLGVGIAETDFGVVVIDLLDDGPAAQAGIEVDDVIAFFGDEPVESAGQLADLIAGAGAGAEVPITVFRFDSEVTVWVVLGESPR